MFRTPRARGICACGECDSGGSQPLFWAPWCCASRCPPARAPRRCPRCRPPKARRRGRGPPILYAPPAKAPQLENVEGLALEGRADPGLGRQRLPQGRVPLPGLPLRRPRGQGGHRPGEPDARARRRHERRRPVLGADGHLRLPDAARAMTKTPPTSSSCGSSRTRRRRPSGSRSTRSKIRAGRDGDRDRRHRRRIAPVPVRRQRQRAGPVLPDRPRRNRRADRRAATGEPVAGPGAERLGRPRPPPDHRRGPAQRVGTRHRHRAARRGRRPVERSERQLPAAGGDAQRDPARAAPGRPPTRPRSSTSRFRFNSQEPLPGKPGAETDREPRLVARIGPGAGARRRGHQRLPRRRRLRQAEGEDQRRHAASRRCPAERRLRPDPRVALRRRAGRRLRDRRLRLLGRLHRRAARPAAAVRDLRARRTRPRRPAGG